MSTPNPPAFPAIDESTYEEGMTLRDYFATKAMVNNMQRSYNGNDGYIASTEYENIAKYSYEMADAMLKERVRTP